MGPDESMVSELTMRPVNSDETYGEEIKWEDFWDITVYPAENSKDADIAYLKTVKFFSEPITLSGTIEMPHKNISRKKFKKWLMHLPQHDRNFAERWCYVIGVLKGRVSYAESYLYMSLDPSGLSLLNFITNKLEETEK